MNGGVLEILAVVAILMVLLTTALTVLSHLRRNAARAPLAYMYQRDGKRVVKHDLDRNVIRIGRHPDNEIQLKDRSVSRFHAQIIDQQNGNFLIRDLDSKNGVRVYFRNVTASLLNHGDVVFIGKVGLRFIHYPSDYGTVSDTVEVNDGIQSRMHKRQRHTERFANSQPVSFYTEGLGWCKGTTRDISEEGMFITTLCTVPMRAPLDIVVQREGDGRWVKLFGEVVRVEGNGVGVVFTDVDRSTKLALLRMHENETEPVTPPKLQVVE